MRSFRTDQADRGATLIFFAVILVGLLAISGLAIDGGRLFAERRQQQNAADSAALAATRELDRYQRGLLEDDSTPTDPEDVRAVAIATATANGGEGATLQCILVDETGAPITVGSPSCPSSAAGDADARLQEAAGVQVLSSNEEPTLLIRAVGTERFTARAQATATVQALRSLAAGASPIMVCGASSSDLKAAVEAETGSPYNPSPDDTYDVAMLINLGDRWEVNPNAVADPNDLLASEVFRIHDNQDVAKCGAGGNGFKGLVDSGGSYEIPSWWGSKTGTTSGPTRNALGSYRITIDGDGKAACAPGQFDDCVVILPICSHSNLGNGTNVEFYCVMFGAFYIVQVDSNTHDAYLLGDAAVVLEGKGGGKPTTDSEARLIKLIE